jgi:hypothetical protein
MVTPVSEGEGNRTDDSRSERGVIEINQLAGKL